MRQKCTYPRVIFLNQMAGSLFRELAEDVSRVYPPCVLFTGQQATLKFESVETLQIKPAPTYIRRSLLVRLLSWLRYFFLVLHRCAMYPKDSLLFLVSNPPFIGLIGYLFHRIRGQRYVVLVYDIYPDILVRFGKLKANGLVCRWWRRLNQLVWENAEIVFTIGDDMAATLSQAFDVRKTRLGRLVVVPNWADVDWIHPVQKEGNGFALSHGQVGKVTVMYSGNLGETHDVDTILDVIRRMRGEARVHFMFIGGGTKWPRVERAKVDEDLDNLTVLPYVPESVLPLSLSTADIALVTLDKGAEGLMVPSKTYYALAAGSAILGLCNHRCEVADTVQRHKCGAIVVPGDVEGMFKCIYDWVENPEWLNTAKRNSREAAVKYFSRANTGGYIEALANVMPRVND